MQIDKKDTYIYKKTGQKDQLKLLWNYDTGHQAAEILTHPGDPRSIYRMNKNEN